ncbi:MAG: ubiquinone/menaquinone biosynthesis methyltransferase [Leptospiraceae bacterium]|nr:ubiquinone/menaquinone biosynthesis methyltransferase [Leptospiraceae bacterium]MCK6380794.1 ubiquinone/menaquinone biosynthesis methyltransferase [Leptospiraceae bacterium]NUM40489.1 ubiquinone/menaquinone biosynthesis methyltransferase [Leptospiraceae bacterium]
MSKFTMPVSEKKADFVRENFNTIAKKYDLFNDLNSFGLHRVWKNTICNIVDSVPAKNLTCLDLCSGTGDITLRLSKLEKVSEIYSVDFSESMLDIAKRKVTEKSKVHFQVGDATNLKNFKKNGFDIVTIGFGLRNVNDLKKALREIYRVLKMGGTFINLDVGKVRNPFIRFFADFYFFKIVPIFGYIIWGGKNDMFDYLPVSSISYPDQKNLKLIMEEIGFKEIQVQEFVFGNAVLHVCKK